MRLRVQLQGLGQSRRGCQEERVVSVHELSGSPRCILSLKRSNAGKPLPPLSNGLSKHAASERARVEFTQRC